MTPLARPISGPMVWRGEDLARSTDWIRAITPAETGMPALTPGMIGTTASMNRTSPGFTPASDGTKRLSGGWKSGKRAFQAATTSDGVTALPLRRTRYVFCHSGPKPCMGLTTSRPSRFRFTAPVGTLETVRRCTGRAQLAASRSFLSDCRCSVIVRLPVGRSTGPAPTLGA